MFLDTSGLLCLLDRRDPIHRRAVDIYNKAPLRLTHGFVLAELVALGNSRRLPGDVLLPFIQILMSGREAEMVWPDERLAAQSVMLLRSRIGAGYSLCDAVSFVLMRQRNISDAFSLDGHFELEGFTRRLI